MKIFSSCCLNNFRDECGRFSLQLSASKHDSGEKELLRPNLNYFYGQIAQEAKNSCLQFPILSSEESAGVFSLTKKLHGIE
jgi:hypothetical protein